MTYNTLTTRKSERESNMFKKVYIVISSDKSVVAVFDSYDKATQYIYDYKIAKKIVCKIIIADIR